MITAHSAPPPRLMLFNSYSFIFLYLPVVLIGFFALSRYSHAFAAGWLALASLLFYGYWNPAYVGLKQFWYEAKQRFSAPTCCA